MLYGSWNRGIVSHLCLICFVTKRTDLFKTRLRLWYKLYVSKTLEGGPTVHIILSIWSLWTFSGFQGTLGYLRQHGVLLKGRNAMLKKTDFMESCSGHESNVYVPTVAPTSISPLLWASFPFILFVSLASPLSSLGCAPWFSSRLMAYVHSLSSLCSLNICCHSLWIICFSHKNSH